MEAGFFSQEKTCPGCGNKFHALRIRSSAQRIAKRDTDFCITYEGPSPLMYGVFVCPKCHFAASDKEFSLPLTDFQLGRLQKGLFLLKGEEPDFSADRDWKLALRGYELAIRSAQIFQAKASYLGSLFLKAAWCCRFLGNKTNEFQFMFEAAKYYQHVYEHETRDMKISEARLLYLIGEMYRRARRYNDAIKWFSLAVSNPGIKREPEIERLARDQWLQTKADLKEAQEQAEQNGEEFVLSEPISSDSTESQESDVEEESTTIKPKVKRTTVSMNTQIYQDQYEWVRDLTNRAHSEHNKVLEKSEIIRAAIDALTEVDVPSEHLQSEEALAEFFKSLIEGE